MARRFQSGAEKIKNELRETVESYKKRLEFLGGIRRVHKKDGSDFQNRLKNFDFIYFNGGYLYYCDFKTLNRRFGKQLFISIHNICLINDSQILCSHSRNQFSLISIMASVFNMKLDRIERIHKEELERARRLKEMEEDRIREQEFRFFGR